MNSDFVSYDWSALLALQRATHATLHALAAQLADLDLTASEINALANLADGRSISEFQRVKGHDRAALLVEQARRVRADVAGAAGHQDGARVSAQWRSR